MPPGAVELQVTALEHRRQRRLRPPGKGPHACDELGERERLWQVVVGAHAQPLDAILDAARCRQHQDASADALGCQPLADLVAVKTRKIAVEHDHVVLVHARVDKPRLTVAGDVDRHALTAKPRGDGLGELSVILHNQYAHMPQGACLAGGYAKVTGSVPGM